MNKLCEACERKDVRELQQRYNELHLAINRVARSLDIEGDTIDEIIKNLTKYSDGITIAKLRSKKKREED